MRRAELSVGLLAFCCFVFGGLAIVAPRDFTPGTIVIVSHGDSVATITERFADARVVTHPRVLWLLLRLSGESASIPEGRYRFLEPVTVLTVAKRLVAGEYGLPAVRLTFIEGVTTREMGEQISVAFPDISRDAFGVVASPREGYLFPDTYTFPSYFTTADIIAMMQSNFVKKLSTIQSDVTASGHSLSAIVTMASLVEKEAKTPEDRRIIAGILWNRIAKNMPLQVDAVFGYIFQRDTYSPSYTDLHVDSPYNTYIHKGLPPGPICNPGQDALVATIHPSATKYLYYITGTDGLMHYAVTYADHQKNIKKYLK